MDFEGVAGSTLAFDGSQLIATQTTRNLERIRNILARYRDVRQVEIEAKFMEVQQGALEELGVQWNVVSRATGLNGTDSRYSTGGSRSRQLSFAWTGPTSPRPSGRRVTFYIPLMRAQPARKVWKHS